MENLPCLAISMGSSVSPPFFAEGAHRLDSSAGAAQRPNCMAGPTVEVPSPTRFMGLDGVWALLNLGNIKVPPPGQFVLISDKTRKNMKKRQLMPPTCWLRAKSGPTFCWWGRTMCLWPMRAFLEPFEQKMSKVDTVNQGETHHGPTRRRDT